MESYNSGISVAKVEKADLVTKMPNYEKRLSNARELHLTEKIDAADYQNRLGVKLNNVSDDKQMLI